MVSFEQIKNQAAAQKEEKKQIAEEEARSFAEIKKQEEEKKKEEERKKAEEKANRLKALQDKYDKTEDVKEKVEKRREEIKDEKLEVAKKRSAISSAVKDLIRQVRESYDEVKEDPNSILADFFLKDKDGNVTKNLNKKKIIELKEIQDQLPGLEKTKEDRSFLKSQEKKYEKVSSDLEKQKEELHPETKEGLKEKEKKEEKGEYEKKEVFGESVLDEVSKEIKLGYEMFNILKNEDGDAIQRRIDSFSADFYTNSSTVKSLFGLEKYENVLSASPEEIKDIYYKDFEGQNSIHEIGAVLSGLNSESFKEGFFNALNNRPNKLSDKLSLKAKIIDKILSARKNNWEK